ncbi:hypothetical protein [Muriicola sp.]|uniref:hypothetical protein n=1 Tax=Muriicola sp. TaxID=2020856 RepID=UPI003C7357C5
MANTSGKKIGGREKGTSNQKKNGSITMTLKRKKKKKPNYNPSGLETVKFIFEKSKNGLVVIDNISFMKGL